MRQYGLEKFHPKSLNVRLIGFKKVKLLQKNCVDFESELTIETFWYRKENTFWWKPLIKQMFL